MQNILYGCENVICAAGYISHYLFLLLSALQLLGTPCCTNTPHRRRNHHQHHHSYYYYYCCCCCCCCCCYFSLPTSKQSAPVNPSGHSHRKRPGMSTHTPPFIQGSGSHSFMSTSQRVPGGDYIQANNDIFCQSNIRNC